MILDDNSREIRIRNVDLVTLKDNTIIFHLKHSETKQIKTYETVESAKEDYEKISRRIESYMLVKAGEHGAGVRHQQPRGKIVRAVDDQIALPDPGRRIVGVERGEDLKDPHVRIDGLHRPRGRLGFFVAHLDGRELDLAVQV